MYLKTIIRILVVCFVVTTATLIITKIYGGVSLLSMPEVEMKYLGSDELSMYIKNGQNKSLIGKIVYSFKVPWYWDYIGLAFFSLFIPMVIASGILVFRERHYQT